MSEVSKLRVYSLGTVAANKPLTSKDIEVVPIEDTPMVNGEVTDNGERVSAKASDVEGGAYETEVPTASSIVATWLPLGNSNRVTAPDVRRGEMVVLYRFADQDKFWWVTMEDDIRLRKLETVIFAISATQDEKQANDAKSTYFMEWSSHKKLIHIHTSKADGEPYTYDIQINTKEGFITIQDDDGQVISLDSKERQLVMKNRDGSILDINKTKILMHADDEIKMTTKSYILETTTTKSTASGSATLDTPDNTTTAPSNKIVGLTQHTGNIVMSGAGGGAGSAQFTGDIDVIGEIRSTGDQIAGDISQIHHKHPENGEGSLTDEPQ